MSAHKKALYRAYGIRLLIITLASFAAVALFNEVTFASQRENFDRPPKTVQLVIPEGTAARVAAGEQTPSIPQEMVFVLGDTLEVVNEDVVAHQLGPVWAPPGGTAQLVMNQAERFSFACSFRTSQYLGIDVRQATDLGVRLTALLLAGPTTAVLIFLYTLVMYPIKVEKPAPVA